MRNNDRDFVDFVIDLYDRRKIFYIIFIAFITLAVWNYSNNSNNYKFDIKLSIANESIFLKIINIHNFLNESVFDSSVNAPNNKSLIYANLDYNKLTYESVKTDICLLATNATLDKSFVAMMVDGYIKSTYYKKSESIESIESIASNVVASLSYTTKGNLCSLVKVSAPSPLINFIESNYVGMLNNYIYQELYERMSAVKDLKYEYMQKLLLTSYSDGEGQNIINRLKLFNEVSLDGMDGSYFNYNKTNISPVVSPIFILFLVTFLSIVTYVIVIVAIDFKEQYLFRKSS